MNFGHLVFKFWLKVSSYNVPQSESPRSENRSVDIIIQYSTHTFTKQSHSKVNKQYFLFLPVGS